MAAIKKAESEVSNPFSMAKSYMTRFISQLQQRFSADTQFHFVFDGSTREAKHRTVETRSVAHDAYSSRCKKKQEGSGKNCLGLIDPCEDTWVMLETDLHVASLTVGDKDRITSRKVMRHMEHWLSRYGLNITAVRAIHDSEEYIARNMKQGDLAVTTDSDALAFGCSMVVQNLFHAETWIQLSEVLDGLRLSQQRFREMCVLLGNDFNDRLKGTGPVKAYADVSAEGFSLENCDAEWLPRALKAMEIFSGELLAKDTEDVLLAKDTVDVVPQGIECIKVAEGEEKA